jgi:hypothetical protein
VPPAARRSVGKLKRMMGLKKQPEPVGED